MVEADAAGGVARHMDYLPVAQTVTIGDGCVHFGWLVAKDMAQGPVEKRLQGPPAGSRPQGPFRSSLHERHVSLVGHHLGPRAGLERCCAAHVVDVGVGQPDVGHCLRWIAERCQVAPDGAGAARCGGIDQHHTLAL